MSQPSSSNAATQPTGDAPSGKGFVLLKSLVIVLGVLIVAGVIALIVGLVFNLQSASGPKVAAPDKATTIRLGLPENTRVRSMQQTRWGLALHLTIPGPGEDAGDWVYILPLDGGGKAVRIRITGGPGGK
jgi:hypothetical protein